MLNRIVVKRYKSLMDVDVTLQPLSVLFGPNAAGKSNFLDALQLLSRAVSSRTLKEAFDPPYRGKPLESFTFGTNGIGDFIARDAATFSIQADLQLSPHVVEKVNQQIREMRRPPNGSGSKSSHDAVAVSSVQENRLRYRIEVEILPRSRHAARGGRVSRRAEQQGGANRQAQALSGAHE